MNCFQNLVPLVSATTKSKVIGEPNCCELLSEFSTFGISNNNSTNGYSKITVVNCFQNLVPLVSATTFMGSACCSVCCELLSEFSTFGISNNRTLNRTLNLDVVNCFQNLVPLVSATTNPFSNKMASLL